MIADACFSAEWQARKREELGGCDPVLLEKTIHAFALLDALAARGLEFVFKGGTSLRWTAEGNDVCIARVNFPTPSLKSKIEGEGKAIEKIKQLAGAVFSRLFIPAISFKPVENFRDEAKALLAKAEANKLIKLCQAESAPRVCPTAGCRRTQARRLRYPRDRGAQRRHRCLSREDTTMLYKNNIGPQVRRKRYALGWSQSTFAAKLQVAGLDISRGGVSKIEARLRFVDDKGLMFLAEVLKVPVQELFPRRESAGRLSEFMEKLETTRF